MTDLRTLPTEVLDYMLNQLERKVAALKFSTTAIGARLLEQYQDKLDAVQLELQRRRA